jgi:hypothetical protein
MTQTTRPRAVSFPLGPLALAVLGLGLLATPVVALAAESPSDAFHVIRPGDTLHTVAQRYLGDSSRWRELVPLNPQVKDPNLLTPGGRLRLRLDETLSSQTALVARVSRQVEERPDPTEWRLAAAGDLLREKDGLRTFDASSAFLRFGDGRDLMVTENSLIFLRVAGQKLRSDRIDAVEIVAGQADLEGKVPQNRLGDDVEILVGGSRAKVRAASDGTVATRARRPTAGGAQLMVYQGASAVEAAGKRVDLVAGTGTVVAQGAAPGEPEALLPAPILEYPAAAARLGFTNATFRWREVPGAVGYTLEICHDSRCGSLHRRRLDLTAGRHDETLAAGTYHWRVTARAASGLDGYPSDANQVVIAGTGTDRTPPTATLSIAGGPTAYFADQLILGQGATLELRSQDDLGIASTEYTLDGAPATEASWKSSWANGPHTLGAVVVDAVGNRARLVPLTIVADAEAPAATWEAGAGQEMLSRYGRLAEERERRRGKINRTKPETTIEWSSDGNKWPRLVPGGPSDKVLADEPMVFLRGNGDLVANDGQGERIPLGPGRMLRWSAKDTHSAVVETRLRVEGGEGAAYRLVIESEDLVGNVSTTRFLIEPR